jgi:hypothetical protein
MMSSVKMIIFCIDHLIKRKHLHFNIKRKKGMPNREILTMNYILLVVILICVFITIFKYIKDIEVQESSLQLA